MSFPRARLLALFLAAILFAACRHDAGGGESISPGDPAGLPDGFGADVATTATETETATLAEPRAIAALALPADLTLAAPEPVFFHGPGGSWDSLALGPGGVDFQNGLFHMLYNATADFSAPGGVGYAVSSDGLVWERVNAEPVLTADQLPVPAYSLRANSLLALDDNTWVLYLEVRDSARSVPEIDIWRATAPDPAGPWAFDAEPVLRHGRPGSWDSFSVSSADVIFHDGQYIMYYAGFDALTSHIGRATSGDGIHWTRYDNPVTTDGKFSASDPVLLAGEDGTWNGAVVHNPEVWRLPDGQWGMVFTGRATVFNAPAHAGLATSPDGINWTVAADNPVFRSDELDGGFGMASVNLVIHEDRLWYYYNTSVGGTSNFWDIYLLAARY